jgi:hypothetical protein
LNERYELICIMLFVTVWEGNEMRHVTEFVCE